MLCTGERTVCEENTAGSLRIEEEVLFHRVASCVKALLERVRQALQRAPIESIFKAVKCQAFALVFESSRQAIAREKAV